MKKHLFSWMLVLLGISQTFGQCAIEGNFNLLRNQAGSFQMTGAIAQCEECHLWQTTAPGAAFEGNSRLEKISLKFSQAGTFNLKLTALTATGPISCEHSIAVHDVEGLAGNVPTTDPNCDIEINTFKEVKVSDNLFTLLPNQMRSNFRYTWTVVYANGEQMTSDKDQPQFPFSEKQYIRSVTLKINSQRCIKEFSKQYDQNFWKLF